ncbi:MAG: SUMF1/EgtB/PvdO family nonheme iron enzyme [Magnetococcales bacterium]|nr:SUMF1/EgtB/PvdO family nonheme iron enzyme [Magnetococcales bacterium]
MAWVVVAWGAEVLIAPQEMPNDPLVKAWEQEKRKREEQENREREEKAAASRKQAEETRKAREQLERLAREEEQAREQARQEQARLEQLKRDRFETLLAQLQTSISGGMKRDAERAYQEAAGLLPGDGRLNGLKERIARMQERVDPPPPPPPPPLGGMEFVRVPGGCFQMGSNDGASDEKPVHEVCVDGFEMGKYEVKVGQFRKFVEETGYRTEAERGDGCYVYTRGSGWNKGSGTSWRNPGMNQNDDHPVVCVTWNDAQEMVKWLNGKGQGRYSLPTEAQWEYAARDGGKKVKYPWGDESPVCRKGARNGAKFDDDKDCDDTGTEPVGSYAASPNLGLYDMAGNVWEWTCSDYGPYSEKNYANCSKGGSGRVDRGGSWYGGPAGVRSAYRFFYSPDYRGSLLGFRLSRTGP